MTRLATCLALLAVVGSVGVSAAAPPKVTLASRPAAVVVATPWQATLVVRGPGKPSLLARLGRTTRRFATRPAGARRFRARVVLPRAGRWALEARLDGRRIRLGSVRAVAPAPPELVLSTPISALVAADGSLLVVENGRGRIVRIDRATGVTRPLVSGLSGLFGIAQTGDGDLLVTSQSQLYRIDLPSGSRSTLATSGGEDFGPVVVAGDGTIYAAVAPGSVVRIPPGGGSPTTLASGLAAPHGLAVRADGGLLVADTGNNRLLLLDAAGTASQVAGGLGGPGPLALLGDGRVLVAQMEARALSSVDPSGAVSRIVPVPGNPLGLALSSDGAAYVTSTDGRVRVLRDGVLRVLRLRAP